MVSDSPTLEVSEFVDKNSEMISKEDKQHHDNDDLQSNFAIEGESDCNQSDEANENGKVEIVPEDASNQKSESRHETESCHSVTGSSSTSKFPDHFVTGNLVASFKDISFKCENEALVEIHVMEAEEIDMKTHEWHASSCVSNETPGYINQMASSCTMASDNDSGKILLHKVHDHSSAGNLVDITVMSQEEFAMAPAPALDKTPSSPCQPLVAGAITGQTGSSAPFADDTLQGQFPRPTELISKKSSTKKQPTSWKMIDAINKENIDDGGKKVEPHKEKENNKVIGEKILDEFSLRQLRKMMKEKLQIANNKNSEEDNDTKVLYFFKYRVFPFSVFLLVLYFSSIFKQVNNHSYGAYLLLNDQQQVGKTRLALQTLADENRRHGAEELK